ncbi:hypothetical protein [Actinoplanes sp. ATCC 53533]|uniref:hypothetical protein n=1 Tax=Actinoplanes sp. ATCC 53533 TaxID=1288362 RepID=UPI0018F4CD0D|nr:hypothetical protein [Actinoplanes sp. ATCC 53533]
MSRYEDVKVAMTDPRISAEVAPQPGNTEYHGDAMPKIGGRDAPHRHRRGEAEAIGRIFGSAARSRSSPVPAW